MIEMDDKDIRAAMQALGRALSSDKVGKQIKRELSKQLRGMVQPMVEKRRMAVLRLASKGGHPQSMRQAIAKQIKGTTRWSGDRAGVSIVQRARSMPRGFTQAGRAFNRAEGWNPTNLGGEIEHQQIRPTEWFDKTNVHDAHDARQGIVDALEAAAAKLAATIRRS